MYLLLLFIRLRMGLDSLSFVSQMEGPFHLPLLKMRGCPSNCLLKRNLLLREGRGKSIPFSLWISLFFLFKDRELSVLLPLLFKKRMEWISFCLVLQGEWDCPPLLYEPKGGAIPSPSIKDEGDPSHCPLIRIHFSSQKEEKVHFILSLQRKETSVPFSL